MRGPACRPGRRRGAPSLCSQSTVEGRQPPPICCCVSVSRCKVAVASPFFTPAAAPQGGCRAARFCGGTFCPGPDFTPVRLCGLPELFRTGRFSPVPPRRFRLAAFVPPRPIVTARLCGLQGFWEWTRFPTARAMPGTSFSRRRFLAPARLCGLTGFLGQAVFANPAHALAFCPSAVICRGGCCAARSGGDHAAGHGDTRFPRRLCAARVPTVPIIPQSDGTARSRIAEKPFIRGLKDSAGRAMRRAG